jgi:hypothetical protein
MKLAEHQHKDLVRLTLDNSGISLGVINDDPWGMVESGMAPTFGFTGKLQMRCASQSD